MTKTIEIIRHDKGNFLVKVTDKISPTLVHSYYLENPNHGQLYFANEHWDDCMQNLALVILQEYFMGLRTNDYSPREAARLHYKEFAKYLHYNLIRIPVNKCRFIIQEQDITDFARIYNWTYQETINKPMSEPRYGLVGVRTKKIPTVATVQTLLNTLLGYDSYTRVEFFTDTTLMLSGEIFETEVCTHHATGDSSEGKAEPAEYVPCIVIGLKGEENEEKDI